MIGPAVRDGAPEPDGRFAWAATGIERHLQARPHGFEDLGLERPAVLRGDPAILGMHSLRGSGRLIVGWAVRVEIADVAFVDEPKRESSGGEAIAIDRAIDALGHRDCWIHLPSETRNAVAFERG